MESCSGMASQCHDLARTLKANNIRVEARENGGGQNGLKSGWVVGGALNKSIKNNKQTIYIYIYAYI